MDESDQPAQLDDFMEWESLETRQLEQEYNEQMKQIVHMEQLREEEEEEGQHQQEQRGVDQLQDRERFEQRELMERLKYL